MKISSLRHGLCLLLTATLLPGSSLLASETVAFGSSDYALSEDGTLFGSVLNQSAKPVAGMTVQVLHQNRVVATAVSDQQGRFAVSGLRNGAHAVQIGASQEEVRFWSSAAAPPASASRMTVIVDEQVVRGQEAGKSGLQTAGALLLFGGAVGATLAFTLDDHDKPASP